jgi:hypothetical protein
MACQVESLWISALGRGILRLWGSGTHLLSACKCFIRDKYKVAVNANDNGSNNKHAHRTLHPDFFAVSFVGSTDNYILLRRLDQLAILATHLAHHHSPSYKILVHLSLIPAQSLRQPKLHPFIPSHRPIRPEMAAIHRSGPLQSRIPTPLPDIHSISHHLHPIRPATTILRRHDHEHSICSLQPHLHTSLATLETSRQFQGHVPCDCLRGVLLPGLSNEFCFQGPDTMGRHEFLEFDKSEMY